MKILIINTGGTFNKKYNRITGQDDFNPLTVNSFLKKWLSSYYDIFHIIQKDSLDFVDEDRIILLDTILKFEHKKIIVIHGTDTMDLSAEFIDKANTGKTIVFTGAMTPYSVDETEASANLASAIGFMQNLSDKEVYISMNGNFGSYKSIKKDRVSGKFIDLTRS